MFRCSRVSRWQAQLLPETGSTGHTGSPSGRDDDVTIDEHFAHRKLADAGELRRPRTLSDSSISIPRADASWSRPAASSSPRRVRCRPPGFIGPDAASNAWPPRPSSLVPEAHLRRGHATAYPRSPTCRFPASTRGGSSAHPRRSAHRLRPGCLRPTRAAAALRVGRAHALPRRRPGRATPLSLRGPARRASTSSR